MSIQEDRRRDEIEPCLENTHTGCLVNTGNGVALRIQARARVADDAPADVKDKAQTLAELINRQFASGDLSLGVDLHITLTQKYERLSHVQIDLSYEDSLGNPYRVRLIGQRRLQLPLEE